ncbi:MAG: hypothetical protein ACXV8U_21660 [Methylobacter sp.]
MKALLLKQAIALSLGLIFMASIQAGSVRSKNDADEQLDWIPSGKGHGAPDINAPKRVDPNNNGGRNVRSSGGATTTGYGISYHGGPVIGGNTHVYYIWYGNWAGNTATSILDTLASSIGGSPYYNINTAYSVGGTTISNAVSLSGQINDNYSQGTTLSDYRVAKVVSNAITSGKLPKDGNGVYFVLTSKDVKESSGFCTQYCGWHSASSMGGTIIKYSFVGNPEQCPNACSIQGATNSTPNNNLGADAMASIIAHELEEAVTDPNLNAWYDSKGAENADKCAWTFGNTYSSPSNGSLANMNLGGLDFLIQQNWVNAQKQNSDGTTTNGYCSLSY